MGKDYYSILGVPKDASPEDVKKAFRRLAHEHHPDKGGDAQKFKDVNEAYQILGDPQKRGQYDRFGSAAFEQGGMGGPGGFGGGGFGFDPSGFNINMEDFGDLGDVLGGMFGFQGRGPKQQRGRDIQVDVALDFLESVHGSRKDVSLYKHELCATCRGEGAEPGSKLISCKTCNGKGTVTRAQRTMLGTFQSTATCSECHGTGKMPEHPCTTCKGVGVERKTVNLQVDIPAGISDGEALKIAGAGEHPGRGGRQGDLFVRITVKSHPVFSREGNDILSTAHVPYSMLVLGGSTDIETVDGPGSLKIPEGTQPGTVFKLRAKGVPFLRSRGRGDHLVSVQPIVEKILTREQRDAIERLKREGL
ncbi:MAG: molecular chaperone DnaJ [Patescibacteria group bacterium]